MTRAAGVLSEDNWGCQRTFMVKLCMAYAPEAGLVRLNKTTSTTSSTTTIEDQLLAPPKMVDVVVAVAT